MEKMEVQAENEFIGVACNRGPSVAAWGPCNLVAFGAHHSVAIFSPQDAKILVMLPGHKDQVNCITWLPSNKKDIVVYEYFMLSGSADGEIILWGIQPTLKKWRLVLQAPTTHDKAVTCISSCMLSSMEAVLASSSSDGTVRVWDISLPVQAGGKCQVSIRQTISVGSKVMVAVSMVLLPNKLDILLAMGGLDNQIHLYIKANSEHQFISACKLKGHQGWVQAVDFSEPVVDNGMQTILLASCSQDKHIRLWRITPKQAVLSSDKGSSLKGYITGPVFRAGESLWQVSLESLLVGHEDWVYSVHWQPPLQGHKGGQETFVQRMCILSASMDKMMMVWKPDSKSGIWMNEVCVGELSHSALGFYGGIWGPDGDAILAHGFTGSFHLWRNGNLGWTPELVPSGHFESVVDIGWSKTREFLLSASHDQTTRIFTPWDWNKGKTSVRSWHEIARPQVHGHDLNCIAVLQGKGNHSYVSGAEEKVARVFEAPITFLDTLSYTARDNKIQGIVNREEAHVLGANMSALGLSQKPIYSHETGRREVNEAVLEAMDAMPDAVPMVLTQPPLEEQLVQNTLWPELHKLYGHGNELFSMCCDHAGCLLATACKAQSANAAEIWLWELGSWRSCSRLSSHTLTVTQMEFSHDDQFLLSVSRDRHFSIFKQRAGDLEGQPCYELLTRFEAHKRIVWACSWSLDDKYFATGSRDKTVKIWGLSQDSDSKTAVNLETNLPPFKSSVTALAWTSGCKIGNHILAIGMENGQLELWNCSIGFAPVNCVLKIDPQLCHVATVNRLMWREIKIWDDENSKEADVVLHLASCGEDHSVRVLRIQGL